MKNKLAKFLLAFSGISLAFILILLFKMQDDGRKKARTENKAPAIAPDEKTSSDNVIDNQTPPPATNNAISPKNTSNPPAVPAPDKKTRTS